MVASSRAEGELGGRKVGVAGYTDAGIPAAEVSARQYMVTAPPRPYEAVQYAIPALRAECHMRYAGIGRHAYGELLPRYMPFQPPRGSNG